MSESASPINLTILYIDDNQDNGYMLTHRLKRLGVACIVSSRPRKTVELILEHQPDLVLLDINMPYVSGFDVLKQIRATDAIASTPVWAFTANSVSEARAACMRAGFDDFIAKPIMRKDIKYILSRFAVQV